MSKPSIRTGSRSSPSSSCSELSASARCWRRCSRRSWSWARASSALRSASSRSRRRSPRSAATRTSTGESRWLAERLGEQLRAPLQLRADDHPAGHRRRGAVVLEQEALGDLAGLALLGRRRGRSPGARRGRRRGPGRPGRWRRVPSTATPIRSALPSELPATRWRSIRLLTALSRSRKSAARSKSCASEASSIFASRSRGDLACSGPRGRRRSGRCCPGTPPGRCSRRRAPGSA